MIAEQTVWEQPHNFVELALPAEWRALMVIQRASRKHLAKLRVAHMRREREKRRQREHRERMQVPVEKCACAVWIITHPCGVLRTTARC